MLLARPAPPVTLRRPTTATISTLLNRLALLLFVLLLFLSPVLYDLLARVQ